MLDRLKKIRDGIQKSTIHSYIHKGSIIVSILCLFIFIILITISTDRQNISGMKFSDENITGIVISGFFGIFFAIFAYLISPTNEMKIKLQRKAVLLSKIKTDIVEPINKVEKEASKLLTSIEKDVNEELINSVEKNIPNNTFSVDLSSVVNKIENLSKKETLLPTSQ